MPFTPIPRVKSRRNARASQIYLPLWVTLLSLIKPWRETNISFILSHSLLAALL